MRGLNPPQNSTTLGKFLRYLTLFCIAWFIFLCLLHYISQRPLWNDETCVLNSIKKFGTQRMFSGDLMNDQVFPRVHLYLIQQIARPNDYSVLSLRLCSFVFMILAFLLWLRIAGYEFKGRLYYFLFVLSWIASSKLVYYSAELKQYSMDVLAGAVFLWYLYRQDAFVDGKYKKFHLPLLLALPLLGFFSYTAFLFMWMPLYRLFLNFREKRAGAGLPLAYLSAMVAVVALSYLFDMRYRHVREVTKGFEDYFILLDSPYAFTRTFWEGTTNLFTRWFAEQPKMIRKLGTFFVMPGFINMFYLFFANIRKDGFHLKSVKTIALILFVELAVLGALQKYPFGVPRTALFFCPVVLYLTVNAIEQMKRIHPVLHHAVVSLYLAFLLVVAAGVSRVVMFEDLSFLSRLW